MKLNSSIALDKLSEEIRLVSAEQLNIISHSSNISLRYLSLLLRNVFKHCISLKPEGLHALIAQVIILPSCLGAFRRQQWLGKTLHGFQSRTIIHTTNQIYSRRILHCLFVHYSNFNNGIHCNPMNSIVQCKQNPFLIGINSNCSQILEMKINYYQHISTCNI